MGRSTTQWSEGLLQRVRVGTLRKEGYRQADWLHSPTEGSGVVWGIDTQRTCSQGLHFHAWTYLYPSVQLLILTGLEKNGFQKTDGVIEHLIGKGRKGRLDSNLNVLSPDCHWYSYGLAGSSTICQITPLTIPPSVKGKPSFHYVKRNIFGRKKMFPESPSPASKGSIIIAECDMGRFIECKFNQMAPLMIHSWNIWKKENKNRCNLCPRKVCKGLQIFSSVCF